MKKNILFFRSLLVTALLLFVIQYADAGGELDPMFNVDNILDNAVFASAVQADGKILIGGQFLARLNTDGSLDTSFDPGGGVNSRISAIAIQSDGKILIGGYFTSYNGVSRNRIARLNTDGSLDTSFDPGTGASQDVGAIAIQSDGKIIIGGSFYTFNGVVKNRIARINSDGSLDASFAITGDVSNDVEAIAIQNDGKIIVGTGGVSYGDRNIRLVRLEIDGSLDGTFDGDPMSLHPGPNDTVYAIAIQSDGKIIVGGNFTMCNGEQYEKIVRLNADGTNDTTFVPSNSAVGGEILSISLQDDGKIIIGGTFTEYGATSVLNKRIARLNTDGSIDVTFDSGSGFDSGDYTAFDSGVYTTIIQPDGKIIVGGDFGSYNGTNMHGIVRLFSVPVLTVRTEQPTYVSSSLASATGDVRSVDGENPERFIEWGTNSGAYEHSCSAGVGGVGEYVCNMTGLTLQETYYVRAKAVNTFGTSYGSEKVYVHLRPMIESLIVNEFQGGGTAQGWHEDDASWDYALPFAYNFYGISYTDIKIGSHGIICLDNSADCSGYPYPDLSETYYGPIIVPLGMYLKTNTNPENDIYITENADNVVIRWSATEYYEMENINFEVILYSNGNIKFNYGIMPELPYGAVVGITNGDGINYVNSIYNTNTNFNQVNTSAWGEFISDGDSGTGDGTTTANNLSLSVSENLTLNCGSSIDLDNGTLLTAGNPQTNTTTCQVTTNDQDGYTLSLTNDRGTNNTLYHTTNNSTQDGQIQDKTPWSSTNPNATNWENTGLGFGILSSTATKNESWWGTANTCNDTTQLYAGIPQTDTPIMQHDTYSNTQTDTTICYKLDIPSTQISGEYTGSVTYTASGRP